MHSEVANLLLEAGLLGEDDLQAILGAVIQHGGTFVQHLVSQGTMDGERLADFLAERTGIQRLDSSQLENLPDFLTRIVDADLAVAYRLVPVLLEKGCLHLAMSDPTDRVALESVAFSSGYKTKPAVASDTAIEKALARYYGAGSPSPAAWPRTSEGRRPPHSQQLQKAPRDDQTVDGGVFNRPPPSLAVPGKDPARRAKNAHDGQRPTRHGAPPEAAGNERDHIVEESTGDKPDVTAVLSDTRVDQVVTLTRVKRPPDESPAGSIGEAIARHAEAIDPDRIVVLDPSRIKKKKEPAKSVERSLQPSPAVESRGDPEEAEEKPVQPPAGESDATVVRSIEDLQALIKETGRKEPPEPSRDAAGAGTAAEQKESGDMDALQKLRRSLRNAVHRDDIGRALVEFGRQCAQRVLLFRIRKDVAIGWMGRGEGIGPSMVKGIIIPLHSPSVFKEVMENQADYYGSIPHTIVNDVFLSALGGTRPARALVIPISVQYKPVALLYADCGSEPDFEGDLAPLHLVLEDVSRAFEKLIIEKKKRRTRP